MKTSKMLALMTLTAFGAASLATASLAQDPQGPMAMFPFDTVDADKDGKVTKAELDAYRASQAVALDANADGKLSVEELTAARLAQMTERATQMATDLVASLDTDGDKALSAAELAARPMPAMLFERADADGDGAVSKAEVEAMRGMMEDRMGGRPGQDGRGPEGRGPEGRGQDGRGPQGHDMRGPGNADHRGFWDLLGDN